MRYLAIDYGTKRTGLAVCDAAETIASPLAVLQGQKDLVEEIGRIVASEDIEAIVLGLPLNMDDSEGPQAKMVRAFAKELGSAHPDPDPFPGRASQQFRGRAEAGGNRPDQGQETGTARCPGRRGNPQTFLDQKAGR